MSGTFRDMCGQAVHGPHDGPTRLAEQYGALRGLKGVVASQCGRDGNAVSRKSEILREDASRVRESSRRR